MKVYIVEANKDYEASDIEGVFKDSKKAIQIVQRPMKKRIPIIL